MNKPHNIQNTRNLNPIQANVTRRNLKIKQVSFKYDKIGHYTKNCRVKQIIQKLIKAII